ncbi:Glycosyltransferase family 25 (LPS biosynthesis protein) [Granulicella rosea]|uniref:Glycosyltransferase family 25 (LPS biosynthesis protein) n=1 Tax=Granulicella rosea TaxID=474952 RepID=A0A239L0B5_9BACT|nr:hypothetical protein [Granulicella rosea]SNT24027.1 Glycosyltransferase family 25 (LPS biosynthesis protein) [Granulicella rosea]
MPLSDYFSLTRVINLADRKDRYGEIEQQLKLLGMPFAPGKVEVFAAQRPTEAAGFPGIGVYGCFLSHLAILKDARDRGVESVLVIEDDLEVGAEDRARLVELMERSKDARWGVLHLGHIQELPPVDEPRLIPFDGPVQTAHLYAIHRDVLPPLIEYLEGCLVRPPGDPVGGPMHYDGALTMFRAANPSVVTLIAQPSLGGQRSSRSDITTRPLDKVPGVKQALAVLRKLKRALG